MEKEAAPQKPVKYSVAVGGKKESISNILSRVFPPQMMPTKKTEWIFGTIFLIVIIIGIFSFPLGSLLAGKTDVSVDIGIPWTFLSFDVANPENLPVKFGGLILDLILYLIIAYAIDVAINAFSKSLTPKRFSKTKRPRIYPLPQKSTAEKIAKQAAEKTTKKIFEKK